jgi:hypothetical protein
MKETVGVSFNLNIREGILFLQTNFFTFTVTKFDPSPYTNSTDQ